MSPKGAQPETHTVTVDGVDLAYWSTGTGTPLVCVHGNFASKRWFAELLAAPPAGWQVIALDLPNFGDSGALPGPIRIGAYADALHGFITALELEAVILLGHSLGGAVVQSYAVTYAAAHPGTLRGLVLLASAAPSGLVTPEAHYVFLEALRGDRERVAQALAPTMTMRLPAYFDKIVDDALKLDPAAFSGNARALERLDLAPALKAVRCAVLVLRGEHDYLISEAAARETAAAFSNARLERLQGIGHSPQIEDPEGFKTLLTGFLEALP